MATGLRPSSGGVAMVGLLPERPQRGKSKVQDLAGLASEFEAAFAASCVDIGQGRPTEEKRLQSWLIRDAYTHHRRLDAVNRAAAGTDAPVELVFITDEIALPTEAGKMVCDILALRVDAGRSTPVLLELKTARALSRLVEQVGGYAQLIDRHADLFEALYGALLGRKVAFDGPAEKWIVWPAAGERVDAREGEMRQHRIRVVDYTTDGEYSFTVGSSAPQVPSVR